MALIYRAKSTRRRFSLRRIITKVIDIFLVPIVSSIVTAILENALAIICACLPTYGLVLSDARSSFSSPMRWYHSLRAKVNGQRRVTSNAHNGRPTSDIDLEQNRNRYLLIEIGPSFSKLDTNASQHPRTQSPRTPEESHVLDPIKAGKVIEVA